MSRELVHVPFHGGEVLAVDIDGKPWIVLRPAFDAIGLDAARQIDNLARRHWATTAVTAVVAADGRTRDMTIADLRTFLMALATISPSRVAEHARPLLKAYQAETANAIEAYWSTGVAYNPRAAAAPRLLSMDETAALLRQWYGMPYATVADLGKAMRAAGITRQTGSPRVDFQHTMWFTGSAWLVVADHVGALARRLSRVEQRAHARLDGGTVQQLEIGTDA